MTSMSLHTPLPMHSTTDRPSARSRYALALLALLPLSLVTTIAQAATDSTGQVLTLTVNPGESSISIYWLTTRDGFGPPAPCNLKPYTLSLAVDGVQILNLNERGRFKLAPGPDGRCVLQASYAGSGFGPPAPLAPGVWTVTAKRPPSYSPQISESQAVYACTPQQGKQPMYSAYNAPYTDHFYTLSASDRNYAVNYLGYTNPDTPFAMPSNAPHHSAAFYRYFKGAPQFEHFYTHDTAEWQFVEQNGYVYEGIEGYLFLQQKPGTTPLYRFTKFNGATSDLVHFYGINFYDWRASGMTYEGVVGYVCPP
jgi:hypothetical protein